MLVQCLQNYCIGKMKEAKLATPDINSVTGNEHQEPAWLNWGTSRPWAACIPASAQWQLFPLKQPGSAPGTHHHSATTKQWCKINTVSTEIRTRKECNAVVTQVMQINLSILIAWISTVLWTVKKYSLPFSFSSNSIKKFDNRFQDWDYLQLHFQSTK